MNESLFIRVAVRFELIFLGKQSLVHVFPGLSLFAFDLFQDRSCRQGIGGVLRQREFRFASIGEAISVRTEKCVNERKDRRPDAHADNCDDQNRSKRDIPVLETDRRILLLGLAGRFCVM